MKKLTLCGAALFAVMALFFCSTCSASVYEDGNNRFIRDGKIIYGGEYSYYRAYNNSGSGRLFLDKHNDGLYHYYDEDFYSPANQGRVSDIYELHPYGPTYIFAYFDNTDSVRYMNYHAADYTSYGPPGNEFSAYYNYDNKGRVTLIEKYLAASPGSNSFLVERRNFNYTYYSRSDNIKEAARIIDKYDEHTGARVSKQRTIRYVDINQVIKRDLIVYDEYDPQTGTSTKHEVKVVYYNNNGNVLSQ